MGIQDWYRSNFKCKQKQKIVFPAKLLITFRHGAISNCQLPITLKVIDNDQITNYFSKK